MPVRNEAAYLKRSLGSVLAQDYPADRLEVLLVDGASEDDTVALIQSFQARDPRIQLLHNPRRIVPISLNLAHRIARGAVILRVDGHCEIQPDYARQAVSLLAESGAAGVGGPWQTIGAGPIARGIALAMSSPFGVGNVAFRVHSHAQPQPVDTVPFPAYSRATLERYGGYDEELVRNQDDEYNYRIRKGGGQLLLNPAMPVRYYSRNTFGHLFRQYSQYGYWKVRVLQKHPAQMQWRQFIPPLFVASVLVLSAASFIVPAARLAFTGIVSLYALFISLGAIMQVPQAGGRTALYSLMACAVLHSSYGLGFLVGLVRFAGRWTISARPD